MHPFHWVPAEGQRHASAGAQPPGGYPSGASVRTLCEQELRADTGELAWLWGTCPPCNKQAHVLAQPQAVPAFPIRRPLMVHSGRAG